MANDVGITSEVGPIKRIVTAEVDCAVIDPALLEYQISVARVPGLDVQETLTVTVDGAPLEVRELVGPHDTRIHQVDAPAGRVHLSYRAEVLGRPDPEEPDDFLRSTYLRPSRYVEADRFFGFAARQFEGIEGDAAKALAVRDFVATRLDYLPGSSGPFDGASETLLMSAGVCRDYAHLTIALLRALKLPARLSAVYAPGCNPMDFHAVAEVLIDGQWCVLDATGLAPRVTMLRIAVGRDAADTAFLDNHGGSIRFNWVNVTAWSDTVLPIDDPNTLVRMS